MENLHDIQGRMSGFLHRQIAMLKEMQGELKQSAGGSEDAAALAAHHKEREAALDALASEFNALKREWDDTEGLSDAERGDIRTLARHAQSLIGAVQPVLDRSVDLTRDRMKALSASMAELRQGRELIGKYKTAMPRQGGGLDRKA